jgi:hypothetical protein
MTCLTICSILRRWRRSGFSRHELRTYVHQHMDACSGEPFPETRALSAATLLDIVAGRHAELVGGDYRVDRAKWLAEVRRAPSVSRI